MDFLEVASADSHKEVQMEILAFNGDSVEAGTMWDLEEGSPLSVTLEDGRLLLKAASELGTPKAWTLIRFGALPLLLETEAWSIGWDGQKRFETGLTVLTHDNWPECLRAFEEKYGAEDRQKLERSVLQFGLGRV